MFKLRTTLALLGLFQVGDAIYTFLYRDASPLKSVVLACLMFMAALLGDTGKTPR